MKLVRIAFQILLCVSSSRLSYATKRDDNIITISSTATTPGSIRKTAALPSAVVPATATATMQSDDTVYIGIASNHKSDNKDEEPRSTQSYPSSLTNSNVLVENGGSKDNLSVNNASVALSTSGKDWILSGNNTDIQLGEDIDGESASDYDGVSVSAPSSSPTIYSDFIIAYECDESHPYIKKTGTTYNQGDNITICVSDESSNIVEVEEFLNLVVTQEDSSDYTCILNGEWNPDITTPVCVDSNTSSHIVCYATIHAPARFFSTEKPSDLIIRGSVYVHRDGRRVRRRKNNEEVFLYGSSRRVQEDLESAEFEVKVRAGAALMV